jgi:DNA polymerase-3 subunit alpha
MAKGQLPPEFMASVLTHTGGQIDKITFFMEECRAWVFRCWGRM